MHLTETPYGSVYGHIGNGGVTFTVCNSVGFGPSLKIESSHFGNNIHTHTVLVSPGFLKELGQMLLNCSDKKFSEVYCYALKTKSEKEADCCSGPQDNGTLEETGE